MPVKRKRRGRTEWLGRVRVSGKERSKTFPTKAQAVEWEVRVRAEMEHQPQQQTRSICLLDLANEYLSYAMRYSPKTLSEKRCVFKRFFSSVDAHKEVSDFAPKEALDYLNVQYRNRSGYAANKERKNLDAAWAWGRKYLGIDGVNPWHVIDKYPEDRDVRYVPPMKDFEKVLEVAEGQERTMLLTFLYLAARRGEVYRLKWADVDFSASQVCLSTKKRMGGSMETEWVPMTDELYRALMEHKQNSNSEWVFVQPKGRRKGKPYTENRGFPQELCEKAGVRAFGCHAIRHLTATLLANQGTPLPLIQGVLRHKRLTTTERYVRTLNNARPHLELLRGSAHKVPNQVPTKKPEGGTLRALSSK